MNLPSPISAILSAPAFLQPEIPWHDPLNKSGIEIDWEPFLLELRKQPTVSSRGADRGTRYCAIRAAYMEREVVDVEAVRFLSARRGTQASSFATALPTYRGRREPHVMRF